MRLLLTSSGINKRTVAEALRELTAKPAGDTKVAYIPTAADAEPGNKDWVISQFINLWRCGYNYIDIVDPSAPRVDWPSRLAEADVIFLGGGNTFYLLDQVRRTGLDKWLEQNKEHKVIVGSSAGTLLMTPTIELAGTPPGDDNFLHLTDLTGLNWVNFEICPHCDKDRFAQVEAYAKTKPYPVYAIDDQTAIQVIDGAVTVVSEGSWERYGDKV